MPHRLGELAEGVVERSLEGHEGEEERDDRLDGAEHPGEQDARGDAERDNEGHSRANRLPQSSPCAHAAPFAASYGYPSIVRTRYRVVTTQGDAHVEYASTLVFTGASLPPAGKETFCRVTRVYWETFKTHARRSGQSSRI